ncbi:MAG TPA: SGNH/GDSL hydrolase family protein [Gaiellaceae bacterium]|nr:SGNH/GDSL hydrolase family protein [Gaiellaceae bacterium]
MGMRRLGCALAVLVGMSCVAAGCGGSSSGSNTSSAGSKRTWSIVALGDSVPHGTNCDCRPYPELTSDGLTASTGQTVKATNDSVAGYTTSHVLEQLKSDSEVIGHLRSADVVEIEVGANDVAYSSACGTATDCYAPRLPMVEKNLASIVKIIHDLASGHKVLVVLLDYWSVWLGGQYAAAHGEDYVKTAEQVTDQVNDIIKSTAAETGSAYVDLRAAFKGPNYAYDETHYLSNDGDHPNAAGHQQIATAAEAVIENALHI